MPTIHDVSKLAGVGVGTVSRVINNTGYVDKKTRERVEVAIAQLGYVPNRLAGSLRSKSTNTLALVLIDITNPFWTAVARGVEDLASDRGFNVILCNTDDTESEQRRYLTMLLEKQVDGFLLVPATDAAESIEWIQRQGASVVVLDRNLSSIKVDTVRGDSVGGARALIRHLIQLGHRRIAMITGPQVVSTSAERVNGYCEALAEAGIQPCSDLIIYGYFTEENGYTLTRQLLESKPRPTALFAANNRIAMGAFRALEDVGLRVPEDISLVAFDGLPPQFVLGSYLTVAEQPAYEMGQRATELLLERLCGQAPAEYQHIVLPAEIIVRKSSGPPPETAVKLQGGGGDGNAS